MSVFAICVFDQDVDDALLASSAPLNNSDALSNIEALSHVVGAHSDFERLRSFGRQFHESVRDVLYEASAIFELSIGDFDSIAALYLKLGIIFDRQLESFVFEEVPLVLVIVVDLVKQLLRLWIDLEKADFLQAGTNILREQFVGSELLVKVPVSEHHLPPEVELFPERLVKLSLALHLDPLRVEERLRNPNVLRVLTVGPQAADGL